MIQHICVFCSSCLLSQGKIVSAAEELGRWIGSQKLTLVYGGTSVGLMQVLADTAWNSGARIVGVVPELLKDQTVVDRRADELIHHSNSW
jgi:predicted Rossmann-fold nucleotide-binding protein